MHDDAVALTVASMKDVVVTGSLNCVYAETDEEFDQIRNQMVEDAMALGAKDVIERFLECYQPVK